MFCDWARLRLVAVEFGSIGGGIGVLFEVKVRTLRLSDYEHVKPPQFPPEETLRQKAFL